jgi:acetoin utilization deacetylase AcuC-like enzyme
MANTGADIGSTDPPVARALAVSPVQNSAVSALGKAIAQPPTSTGSGSTGSRRPRRKQKDAPFPSTDVDSSSPVILRIKPNRKRIEQSPAVLHGPWNTPSLVRNAKRPDNRPTPGWDSLPSPRTPSSTTNEDDEDPHSILPPLSVGDSFLPPSEGLVANAPPLTVAHAVPDGSRSTALPTGHRVLVVAPLECFGHWTHPLHQESAKRLAAIVGETAGLPAAPTSGIPFPGVPTKAIHPSAVGRGNEGCGSSTVPVPGGSLMRADVSHEATVTITRSPEGVDWPYIPLSVLTLVHDLGYLRHIAQLASLCAAADRKAGATLPSLTVGERIAGKSLPSSLQRQVRPVPLESLPGATDAASHVPPGFESRHRHITRVDSDTWISSTSLEACFAAATAACRAVDDLARGEATRMMVVARPPGHHAGVFGAVPSRGFTVDPSMASSGFGLVNVAAVAAAYARSTTNTLNRIAIVDIDVHHGNGTEDIVRSLSPREVEAPLPGSWAPQRRSIWKPWLSPDDPMEVFFASVHLHSSVCDTEGRPAAAIDVDAFYPETGGSSAGEASSSKCDLYGASESDDVSLADAYPAGIVNCPLPPIEPTDPAKRAALTPEKRRTLCQKASEAWRSTISTNILPRLRALQPDLLVISAGFDASHYDNYYFLTESDFEWAAAELSHAARDASGHSRVLAVLEGGYATGVSDDVSAASRRIGRGKKGKISPVASDLAVGDCGLGRCVRAFVRGLHTPISSGKAV